MGMFLEFKKRAENGTRTRDLNLGKVALYQLSYFRDFRGLIGETAPGLQI